jgi:hypothetical protein
MFFFFGPFEFLLPFLIIYFIIRTVSRGSRDRFGRTNPDQYLDQERPRVGLNRQLRASIYRLADRQKGKLTVSDVVIETGMDVEEIEEILQSMVDNQHVRMEVYDDGVVYYEFPEIMDKYRNF